ncbi:lytic transglycosylase [Methylobacterium durans]|uniref:Lytic transglycosylase n=1 Tax=Methylobacterium durans TaxID=2202825 RepID=A0A2U8WER6_9HYPH|nr:lytic transglycosylase [Methylobacterium durans]
MSPPAQASRADPSGYKDVLAREARARGLPPAVADAVAFVESGFNAGAVGSVGELGLMQVRPATAVLLGHTGPAAALLDPATNVRFGVAYLARAWTLAGGDLCRALMKYRAGHGEERMTARSVAYCRRARDRLAATGSPLASAVLPAAVPSAAGSRSPTALAGQTGRQAVLAAAAARLWAEHAARVRAIEARTDRIMRGG